MRQIGWGSVALAGSLAGCGRGKADPQGPLEFWAMGREAEVVTELLGAFHARHPDVRVRVQQLPWTAAHEKLLTAYAGDALPDLCQLGNTWLPEFSALGALEPLDERMAAAGIPRDDYFAGVLDTNLMPAEGGASRLLGVPWYVDTRLIFYRTDLLRAAGHAGPPETWTDWRAAMQDIRRARRRRQATASLLPLNEPDPLFALSLQQGPVLKRRRHARRLLAAAVSARARLLRLGLSRRPGAADDEHPGVQRLGRIRARPVRLLRHRSLEHRRVPASPSGRATRATGPLRRLPGPDGPGVSTAGGSSLVIFSSSRRKEAAWKLIRFLSEPETMQRFHALTGDLPPRRSAWRAPALADDPPSQAFARQLERVRAAPKIPEWERIFQEMQLTAERVVQGRQGTEAACRQLDAWVDALLEKRRWLRSRRA